MKFGAEKIVFLTLIAVIMMSGIAVMQLNIPATTSSSSNKESGTYVGIISVDIKRASGTEATHWYSGHNLITLNGLVYFENRISTNTSTIMPINNISIGGNTSLMTMADLVLANSAAVASCGGTSATPTIYPESAGSFGGSTGQGNITFGSSWTSTCANLYVNTTGLFNGTGGSVVIAEAPFTNAVLQSGDQIYVNYSIGFTNTTWG